MSISLREYLENQRQLELEAAQEYPWDPKECTFHLDVGRQHFYACKTCPGPNAICYACSIHCHTKHELVEVNAKRDIKCDCGTTRIGGDPCELRKIGELEKPNDNKYCHNFKGEFCDCNKEYGGETMYQCRFGVACNEDWFHEDCIPVKEPIEGLFICWKCVSAAELEYFEELGYGKLIEHRTEPNPSKPSDQAEEQRSTTKRKRAQSSLILDTDFTSKLSESKDPRIISLTQKYPYLSHEEQEYEKLDEQAEESLLDSGMRALNGLDYDVAAAGLESFQVLRENVTEFFASWDANKVVTSNDIRELIGRFSK